jgi:hypothetical protein
MELHPDQRPDSVEAFRQFLFGTKELPPQPMLRPRRAPALQIFFAPPESFLLGLAGVLLFLGLIATLSH